MSCHLLLLELFWQKLNLIFLSSFLTTDWLAMLKWALQSPLSVCFHCLYVLRMFVNLALDWVQYWSLTVLWFVLFWDQKFLIFWSENSGDQGSLNYWVQQWHSSVSMQYWQLYIFTTFGLSMGLHLSRMQSPFSLVYFWYLRLTSIQLFYIIQLLLRPREQLRSIVMNTCVSGCLSVCSRGYLRNHMHGVYQFLCTLPMAVAQSSSGRVTKSQKEGAVLGVFFPIQFTIHCTVQHYWPILKRLNWSRCRFGWSVALARGIVYYVGWRSPWGRGNFGGKRARKA